MNTNSAMSEKTVNRLGRIAVALAAAWFVVHVAVYVFGLCNLEHVVYKHLEHALKHFFGWQALGFLVLAIIVSARRPSVAGRVLGGYLALSAVALLAFSKDAAMVARFAAFLAWMACTTNSMKLAIRRAAGERYATWGVAMAAVYAAAVPVAFVLGILNAITPAIVGAIAVAVALPGSVAWLRYLLRYVANLRGRRAPYANDRVIGDVQPEPGAINIVGFCLLEVMGLVLAAQFVVACTSEIASDSSSIYLPYMLRVVADHGLSHQYACWYRLQPMGTQTYNAAIIAVGSVAVAKWFSWFALAALATLVVEEAARRSGSRNVGLFAGAAVVSCPILANLFGTLYVDHPLTLLCTAGFVVMFRALQPPCLRGLLLSAIMMAAVVQIKYPGLVFAVVWGLFLTFVLLRKCGWSLALQWSLATAAFFVALGSPWFVYVYMGTGNPFYPFLDSWFPSPYWPKGFHAPIGVGYPSHLGIKEAAAYPWEVFFRTSHYVEGCDGALSFWWLALVPCWFLAMPRFTKKPNGPSTNAFAYWDMAAAGSATIGCILLYTPYVRYWLPGYPLLVASCVLAAAKLIRSADWRLAANWPTVFSGVALALLLLLPMPQLCLNLPWDAYAKRISTEEYLERYFPGQQAIKRFNRIVKPTDGVLCTGCGVYLVGGHPYNFDFWWNDIHRIHDSASFADFCRRYDIRYWLIDRSRSNAFPWLAKEQAIVAKYWTDARIVAAGQTVVAYDVRSAKFETPSLSRQEWPATIDNPEKARTHAGTRRNWVNLGDVAAKTDADAIVMQGNSKIGHVIRPERPGCLCRIEFNAWSDVLTHPLIDFTWYDADGRVVEQQHGATLGESDYSFPFYVTMPPNANYGRIDVREWQQQTIRWKSCSVVFWRQAASVATRHDTPDIDSTNANSRNREKTR
jgi:hypothetical protein